ncbi:hypothetical protein BU25DRAFT_45809 [Macroventuria anomochaeta]|uniref:Uncharacterized protein n=1 Tax=Macroventuria anomochaeta TaxID=301207 RepID=A0ACB6S1G7_9PLEO|nr:uncharacterized protein BU25DRAFT_45809 [Macroventuria anomochaeta]KAF2627873.1 hypothetical protein BU25DRAFT_45809 [Macroventuria anomochaeta]
MHDHRPPRSARQTVPSEETYPRNQGMAPSYTRSSPARQHSEESWIDISSRLSSSSLSSAADEIITTGLTVQHDSNLYRRNRRPRGGHFQIGTGHLVTSAGGGNSSQEEYDESESESDRVMTSSNEHIGPSPLRQEVHHIYRGPHSVTSSDTMSEREEEDEDDDENATAVNYPRSTARQFQPRPNAFSHPSAEHIVRSQSGTVYIPRRPATRPGSQRQHSYPQHTPYNVISPGHQADHDEALRASLSTLLSAAAAVRGLPKPGQSHAAPAATSSRVDPSSLRMVPESVALGDMTEETNNGSSSRTTSSSPSDKSKRKASPAVAGVRSSSRDRHAAKKARKQSALIEEISPTLFTWVVSAGVVVLVSALSFSAGYVVGNEAGYAEAVGQMGVVGSEGGSCGKEAVRGTGLGLRRLRWTGGAVVRV